MNKFHFLKCQESGVCGDIQWACAFLHDQDATPVSCKEGKCSVKELKIPSVHLYSFQ